MMRKLSICAAAIAAWVAPAMAQAPVAKVAAADSVQPHSNVSIAVEPTLSDGRLVVRMAFKNRGTAPVPFGPSGVSIAKMGGEPIALVSLQKLVDDVRIAAGLKAQVGLGTHATDSAYAAPTMPVAADGRVDVSGYTGGMGISGDENLRRSKHNQGKSKAMISPEEANRQIRALNSAILQDQMLQPNQIAVGQVVSEPFKLKKGEDRTLHLRVRLAGDEHGFTIMAPNK